MDTDDVLRLLKAVAADVITPRFRSLADGEVHEKGPGDLVTIADREAEVVLTRELTGAFPGAVVVGEEACAADPATLDRLVDAPHAFTVDPVDGTKNFVHGSPNHAVMVAEIRDGATVRAWVWQPEHGTAFVAESGAGMWANGVRVTPPQRPEHPGDLRVLTSRPEQEGPRGDLFLCPTAWCCGVDYPWVAQGIADAVRYSRGMPWDHAPGSLFVAETGGLVRTPDDGPYDPRRVAVDGLVVSGSPAVHDVVFDHLSRIPAA